MSQTIVTPPTVSLGTDYIGQPTNRVDGPVKVSGEAYYAADYPVADLWYGHLMDSPNSHGLVT